MTYSNQSIISRFYIIIAVFVLIIGVWWLFATNKKDNSTNILQTEVSNSELSWETEILAENLNVPWDIAFLPDQTMLVIERQGRVLHLEGGKTFMIENVRNVGEGGLLGIALHPNFSQNNWVYLYQTVETSGRMQNQVVRYVYTDEDFVFNEIILDQIPGASIHNGGRIEFGPDGMLYIATGDAGNESLSQDTNSLAGSILRIFDDGSIPEDNPFGNAIYSYGHRNPQGLTWDADGRLWSTEHGRSGLLSGYDEINLIEKGSNYGWPDSQGDQAREGTVGPAFHSGPANTWAPASLAYRDNSIFFGGLRGQTLYEARLDGGTVTDVVSHFEGEFGRIRTVRVGPDGYLYLTTSNQDGRGSSRQGDDKIIRIK